MSGARKEIRSEMCSSTPSPYPSMSHVKRIVLEFESRDLLFSSSNPAEKTSVGRPLPVHSLPDTESNPEDVEEFYDQVPDHVMYRGGYGMPKHVERKMLKRQHSLLFECNWWLDGEKMQLKQKKPSFKKKVKKFFSSLLCSSHKNVD